MTKMDGRAFHHHRGALRSIAKNERLGEGQITRAAVTDANVQTTTAIDAEPALQQILSGSIHPPPAPFGDGERINIDPPLAIGERSAKQAPIASVRR